ncbi:MAG: AAA family ATPase [Desulfobacterales bacterium]|nr:AAA family ATPase [Desulfobacterales bacterium]
MMNNNYRSFFGLKKEPFGADISLKDILKTAELIDVKQRFDYVIRLGAVGLVTGEVGSGKSTAIRYAAEYLHPSEFKSLYMTASSGSIMEFYRQLINELDIHIKSNSKAIMLRLIKKEIIELVGEKKIKVVLLVDEASLLRLEVFAELHTLCQFEKDSKPYLPMVLAGQNNLIDKLSYRSSQPLASRIVARSHLQGTDLAGMQDYLKHHLTIAGIKQNLFDQNAITAIHQGSGGLFRKANHLARGALIAAAAKQCTLVNAEHVRLAATEIF